MGSEGSKPDLEKSIRKTFDGQSLSEHAPAETDHPYGLTPGLKSRKPASAEEIRRQNNQNRDDRNSRWRLNQGYYSTDERSESKDSKE